IPLKRRSASCWKACVARTALAELCRKEGINQNLYYRWSKEFLEAGKKRLAGDTAREATSDEVKELKAEARQLTEPLAEVRIETAIVNLALEEPDLSPRELAVNFTDTKGSFVSEATVYRLLKDHGLITSPAFILMQAADRFANPTTAPNQLWQTDFTYLKVIG